MNSRSPSCAPLMALLVLATLPLGCSRPVQAVDAAALAPEMVPGMEAAVRRPRHPMIALDELPHQAVAPPRSGFQLLPTEGPGYYHFRGSDRPGTDAWGEPATIRCIEQTGQRWARDYPKRPRIGVGDISRREGGRFRPHRSHRHGRDIDLRPLTRRGEHKVHVRHAGYSSQWTRDLVEVLLETCEVQVIYFNDWRLIRKFRKVRKSRGHNDHLHVRLRPQSKPTSLETGTRIVQAR